MGILQSQEPRDLFVLSTPTQDDSEPNSAHSMNKSGRNKKKHSSSSSHPHRIPTCTYNEKCPSIKHIKHKHYTISDLIHLTEYSHSRK